MALYDKVVSILSIPDKNSNDSIDINSTSLYEQWAQGDGQYLLPLLLVFIIAFCCICAAIQVALFLILLCARRMLGADEEEEEFKEKENSKRDYQLSLQMDNHLMGSHADSTGSTPGDGTPRSRKSTMSSQKNSV